MNRIVSKILSVVKKVAKTVDGAIMSRAGRGMLVGFLIGFLPILFICNGWLGWLAVVAVVLELLTLILE